MKKFLLVAYLTFLQMFSYRLSFVLWRIRNVFNLIFIYFLWTSIFANKNNFLSYSPEKLITYILVITLISNIVLSTKTHEIAADILSGDLSNYLLKPFSFFRYIAGRELSDKLFNLFFTIIEVSLLVIFLKPHLYFSFSLLSLLYTFFSISIGIMISFFISLNISFISFWSNEVWAPRWIYFIFIWFFAGSFFPLDMLPQSLYRILLLTPFPYLFYLPTKIYLDGFSFKMIFPTIISLIWCLLLFMATKNIWKKGIKNYSAYGR